MVWCNHCGKNIPGIRPYDGALACNLCGRILENFNYSEEVTFVKNAAGDSQASGNIVNSVASGMSFSRQRRLRIAEYELMTLKDALGIGDGRDDVIDMAAKFFRIAADQNFTKGRRSELVLSSCLYLACRLKNIPYLLIDFSSYYEATLAKRLIEFGNTEAASFTADELSKIEKERATEFRKRKPNSDKEGVVLCMHQGSKPVGYGLCQSCYNEFMNVSGELEGGLDPPAFQRAEKQRMKEKASREENDEQVNSYDEDYEDDGHSEASDESDNLSDAGDSEIDNFFLNEDERCKRKTIWEEPYEMNTEDIFYEDEVEEEEEDGYDFGLY